MLYDMELLRSFVAAADSPTLSVAAAARRVTKSAISQQLKLLESQLGLRLFERVGKTLRPTAGARALAESLRHAFALVDLAIDTAKDTHGAVRGEIRIGAPRPFTAAWLRPRLAGILKAHPGLVLDVSFGVPSALERELAAGRLDLAVLSRTIEHPSLTGTTLFVEKFRAVASHAYLKARGTPRAAADWADHTFVVWGDDRPMHGAWWRATFGAKAQERGTIACKVASLEEMLALAVAGIGIAVLPDYFVAQALADRSVESIDPPARSVAQNPIVLAWRKDAVQTASLRAVKDALLEGKTRAAEMVR